MDAAIADHLDEVERALDEFDAAGAGRAEGAGTPEGSAIPWPPARALAALEGLCGAYLAADAEARSAIRALVAERVQARESWLMWECASRLTERATGADAPATLRLALAAVSVDNCGLDNRETLTLLFRLYEQAERAGLDPRPEFEAAAALSADAPTPGGCTSVAQLMRRVGAREVYRERRPGDA